MKIYFVQTWIFQNQQRGLWAGPSLAGETTAIEFGRTLLLLSIALVYQLLAVDTRMLSDILILREKWQSNFVVTFFKALDSRHQSSLGSSLAPFSTACTTITCFFQAYQKMSAIVNLEIKKCASSNRFLAFCFNFGYWIIKYVLFYCFDQILMTNFRRWHFGKLQ